MPRCGNGEGRRIERGRVLRPIRPFLPVPRFRVLLLDANLGNK